MYVVALSGVPFWMLLEAEDNVVFFSHLVSVLWAKDAKLGLDTSFGALFRFWFFCMVNSSK